MKKCKYIILGMLAILSVTVLIGCGKKANEQSGSNSNQTDSNKLNELMTDAADGAKELATDAVDGVKEIVTGAAEGASELMTNISETMKNR